MGKIVFDHEKVMRIAEINGFKGCPALGCGNERLGLLCGECIQKYDAEGINQSVKVLFDYHRKEIGRITSDFIKKSRKKSTEYLDSLK